jgi:diguanylate cyclase (GGDEF)-like protein
MMPEVSGEDVLKAVREDNELKDLPVILLTARASHEDRILGLNLGADDYLAKPIITDEILLRVKNILSRIDLARERSQMNVMERQNEIISSLLEIGAEMQLIDNLDEFLINVLAKLDELFTNRSFAMMIVGPREDIIANIACVEVTADEKKLIIEHQAYVVHKKSNSFDLSRKKYIEKEVEGTDRAKMATLFEVPEEQGWVMLGGEIQTPGVDKKNVRYYLKLFIKGTEFSIDELDTLKVFLDQVLAASRNKLLAAKLDRMAHTDALTGAYNRAYFMPELEKQIKFSAESENMNFAILMCDINGLKQVNDECGHEEGDDLIIKCFTILNEVSRDSDLVIRQGGDEFIILCPATDEEAATSLLERIREVEQTAKVSYKKKTNGAMLDLDIRMAIGLASSENNEAEQVLKIADERMYADKEKFYADKERYR